MHPLGRTPKGSYSPRGRSRHLLQTPFSEPLLRTLLRTPFYCKNHILKHCVAVRPLRRAPYPWVQKFYPVGTGAGVWEERLLWHLQTPVLHWINFSLRCDICEQCGRNLSVTVHASAGNPNKKGACHSYVTDNTVSLLMTPFQRQYPSSDFKRAFLTSGTLTKGNINRAPRGITV